MPSTSHLQPASHAANGACSTTLTIEGVAEPMGAQAPAADRAWPRELFRLPVDLDGGEIIILAIKPSTWFIVFDSLYWVLACVGVAACAGWISGAWGWMSQTSLVQAAMAAATVRLGAGILRWASSFYVLTNRRVMRIYGVWNVVAQASSLLSIRTTRVTLTPPERWTRTGSIHFNIDPPTPRDLTWVCVSQPEEVHAEIRKAIQRAIDNHG